MVREKSQTPKIKPGELGKKNGETWVGGARGPESRHLKKFRHGKLISHLKGGGKKRTRKNPK